jgi:UPF0755 protein
MRPLVRILLVLVLVLLTAAIGAGALFHRAWHGRGPLAVDATVVIDPGSRTIAIARQLQDAGVIEDWRLFIVGTTLFADRRSLRAGEYRFGVGMSQEQVMRMMISGATYARRITIPEGFTTTQALKLVRAAEGLIGDLPPDPPGEGQLLPETYFYTRGETRFVVVNRMVEAMQQSMSRLWTERAAGLPYDAMEKALVLASIVEKETSRPSERAHIAGVFINRIRRGMPLQSDPTVIYAVTSGMGPLGRDISAADLQVKDPYNTYLFKGLPPGPICNPGLAAIEAVLHPMPTKDLYFVADGSGGHAFAQTLEAHNHNVAAYRKAQIQQAADQAAQAEAVTPADLPAASGSGSDDATNTVAGSKPAGVKPDASPGGSSAGGGAARVSENRSAIVNPHP